MLFISILKIILLFNILVTNKTGSIKSGNKLIKIFIKPKTRKFSKFSKLFKSEKLKSEKLPKSQNLSKNEDLLKFEI